MIAYSKVFEKCIEVTLFIFLSIVILLVLIQVLSRYLIQLPFVGIEELSIVSLSALAAERSVPARPQET